MAVHPLIKFISDRQLNVDPELANAAADNLSSGKVLAVGYSGKVASGKDSVAAAVAASLGADDIRQPFAHQMKLEARDLMHWFAQHQTRDKNPNADSLAEQLSEAFSMPPTQAAHILGFLWLVDDLQSLDGYSRHPAVRRLLQYLGTNVRRAQNEDYWIERVVESAVPYLAEEKLFGVTDVRFPNEATRLREFGIPVVRLEVTEETQRRRLHARDGRLPTPGEFYHESETALDGYSDFDLVVDNNGPVEPTIAAVLRIFAEGRAA